MMAGPLGIPDHNDSTHRAMGIDVIEAADVPADTHPLLRRGSAVECVAAW
ncbi:hypothetical protein [Nonomuraea sp. B1E8]